MENKQWWSEEYGFFGDFYVNGDDSLEGYKISQKKRLVERTIAEVDGVIKLLRLKPGYKILDCPCGYGRHSIELSNRGFTVTGSDLNSKHLSLAKYDATKKLVNIKFIKENMLNLKYDSEFDAVINMFYSFGFFDNDEDNFKVLKNFYNALKPNGKFLMHTDVNIPYLESGKYPHDETRNLTNGGTLRIVDKYDPITKRINGFWEIMDKNGKKIRKDYSVRVYTKEEFVSLCIKVGFRFCEEYSDWNASPYSKNAQDMIIIATK